MSATLGLSGGTLTAVASSGTVYTLTVPEGAVAIPTEITMTPVSHIEGIPTLGRLTTGVELAPAGLVFANPLTLTVAKAHPEERGVFPLAVHYEGKAAAFRAGLADWVDGAPEVVVPHFSGVAIDFGTTEDLDALFSALPPSSGSVTFGDELLDVAHADPVDEAAVVDLVQRWLEEVLVPEVDAAGDDSELTAAAADFGTLRVALELTRTRELVEAELAAELDGARAAFVPKLQAAIARNNELCLDSHELEPLRNVLFWQKQATILGVDTAANGLDVASVNAALCARVVIDGASLPEQLQVGFPHSLDFRLLLKFSDDTQLSVPFAMELSAVNATLQHPAGNTDPFGNYTTVLTANAAGAVTVFITGHAILPGDALPTIIEGTFTVSTSSGVNFEGDYMGSVTYDGSSSSIVHTAHVTQNQNALQGTFESALFSGTLSATLSGTQLLNASLTINGVELQAQNGTAQTDPSTGNTTISLPAPGSVPTSGSAVVISTLVLNGPDVRFENLDEGGPLTSMSRALVRTGSNPADTVPVTGTLSITAAGASATFSGGDVSGSFSGATLRPQVGNSCVLVGIALDSLTVCGHEEQLVTLCLTLENGYSVVFIDPGWTCGAQKIDELRLYVDPSPGGLFDAE